VVRQGHRGARTGKEDDINIKNMTNKSYFLILALLLSLTICSQAHSNGIVAEGEAPVKVADSYSLE
jgi:hypothetical protein